MVKNRLNYDFPSGIVNEIEKPLRRKFRKEKMEAIDILLIVISVAEVFVILMLLHLFISRIVTDQAHAEQVSKQITYGSLCEQYKADVLSIHGTAAEETLQEVCNPE